MTPPPPPKIRSCVKLGTHNPEIQWRADYVLKSLGNNKTAAGQTTKTRRVRILRFTKSDKNQIPNNSTVPFQKRVEIGTSHPSAISVYKLWAWNKTCAGHIIRFNPKFGLAFRLGKLQKLRWSIRIQNGKKISLYNWQHWHSTRIRIYNRDAANLKFC